MKHHPNHSKDQKNGSSEASIEDQLTDEQRDVLENKKQEHSIEEQRSNYEGFIGDQR